MPYIYHHLPLFPVRFAYKEPVVWPQHSASARLSRKIILNTTSLFAAQRRTPSHYAQVERKAAIPVDSKGRCIVAGVIERATSGQVQKWRCTAECKLPNTEARESIAALKVQFDGSRIPDLRQALDGIDGGCPYQHFSTPYSRKQKGKREYNADCTRELKGHPLPCAQEDSGCLSTLRILRAAAPHYPRLRKLLQHVYEALRLHRFINDIDVSLCNGDFEQLCLLLGISNYAKFLGPGNDSADHYSPEISGEAQVVLYQQPNLPEAYLHVQYAEVICKLEKKMADDPEFPCCSCERLMQRKQVTAFKFSDSSVLFQHVGKPERPHI